MRWLHWHQLLQTNDFQGFFQPKPSYESVGSPAGRLPTARCSRGGARGGFGVHTVPEPRAELAGAVIAAGQRWAALGSLGPGGHPPRTSRCCSESTPRPPGTSECRCPDPGSEPWARPARSPAGVASPPRGPVPVPALGVPSPPRAPVPVSGSHPRPGVPSPSLSLPRGPVPAPGSRPHPKVRSPRAEPPAPRGWPAPDMGGHRRVRPLRLPPLPSGRGWDT